MHPPGKLSNEGLRIAIGSAPHRGRPHMGDDNVAAKRMVANEADPIALARRLSILDQADIRTFAICDAPAIPERAGGTAVTGKRRRWKGSLLPVDCWRDREVRTCSI